jgi:hypothetical protein
MGDGTKKGMGAFDSQDLILFILFYHGLFWDHIGPAGVENVENKGAD